MNKPAFMKRTTFIPALLLSGMGLVHAAPVNMSSTFAMSSFLGYDQSTSVPPNPGTVNTDNTVTATYDYAAQTWGVSSTTAFFGFNWTASNGQLIEAPGDYTLNTATDTVSPATPDTTGTNDGSMHFTVGTNQVAGIIDFAWNGSSGIRVVNVWNVDPTTHIPSNVTAAPGMENGPFGGFNAAFFMTGVLGPTANNDAASCQPAGSTTVNVVANDEDLNGNMPPVGDTVQLITASPMASGATLTNNGDGTITYDDSAETASPPSTGTSVTFQYRLTNSSGAVSKPATVTINYTASGASTLSAPNNVSFAATENSPATVTISTSSSSGTATATGSDGTNTAVIATDSISSKTIVFNAANNKTANGGTISIASGGGSLTYTPANYFFGTDTFKYTVEDNTDSSTAATMTINVARDTSLDRAPTCSAVSLGTPTDTPLSINVSSDLLSSCTDPEGDTVSYDSVGQPAQSGAMVSYDGAGTITYTPPSGYTGADSFPVTVTDGYKTTTFTVNVKVGQLQSNFTMLDKSGKVFGGTNDVKFTWDGNYNTSETDTNFSHMSIATTGPTPFFGSVWHAHNIQVFGPGTYYFETDNTKCQSKKNYDPAYTKTYYSTASDMETSGCPGTPGGPTTQKLVVPNGEVGAHMLFDYNGSFDIDVINVWKVNAVWNDPTGQGDGFDDLFTGPGGTPPSVTTTWALTSVPANANASNGGTINGSPMVDGPFVGFYANFNKDPGGAGKTPIVNLTAPNAENHNFLGSFSWQTLLLVPGGLLLFRRRRRH